MRWSRLPVIGLLLWGGLCLGQIPERGELTATPKYVEESLKPSFRAFTEAQLRTEIKVLSTRSYAVYGCNTPEVRVQLPKVSNSAYSKIEFGPATLLNAAGHKVPFELEESGYMDKECASEIRFQTGNPDKLIQFAHVRGRVKVRYPLAVKTAVITPTQPGPPELAVKIDGPYVNFAEDETKTPETSFSKLRPLRAYDAQGRQLEQHGYSETTSEESGEIKHTSFYGNVARVEIDTVESWAELDLTYDLTPAPMLPAGHEGEDPESYKK
jgi:hypothetical protein